MGFYKKASIGMLWLSIGTVIAKFGSFLSLLVLGWFLNKEDFALFAITLSSSSLFYALRNGGIHQLLLQRGEHVFSSSIGLYSRYALMINGIVLFCIIMISPIVVKIYGHNEFYILMSILAFSVLLNTNGITYRTYLASELKFADVAIFDMYSALVRYSSTIFLAIIGFGVYSMVIPFIIVAIFESLYGKFKARINLYPTGKLTIKRLIKLIFISKWILLTAVASTLTLQGDYFVIGFVESLDVVGLYYFGFQVIIASLVVLSHGMQSVLLPVLSKIKSDRERQANAFIRMVSMLSLVMPLVSGLIVIVAPFAVHVLWGSKWEDAIIVIQVLAVSISLWMLIPVAKSILESRGKWKSVTILTYVDAVGSISAAVIGALIGGLLEISIFVCSFKIIYGILCLSYVSNELNLSVLILVKKAIFPILFMILLLLIVFLILFDGVSLELKNVIIQLVVFSLFYFIIIIVLSRDEVFEIFKEFKNNFIN